MRKNERIDAAYEAGRAARMRGENMSRYTLLYSDSKEKDAFVRGYYDAGQELRKTQGGSDAAFTKRS